MDGGLGVKGVRLVTNFKFYNVVQCAEELERWVLERHESKLSSHIEPS